MSDIRGDLKIKQDQEAADAPPNLDEISQYSDVQDTSGYPETEGLLTPMYEAQRTKDVFGGFDSMRQEDGEELNFATFDNDVSSNKAQTNNTSTRSNLSIGPAGISDRNVPKGYIRTGGKFASLNSVEGKRAKMRLDRLRKLQMRIKAGK